MKKMINNSIKEYLTNIMFVKNIHEKNKKKIIVIF